MCAPIFVFITRLVLSTHLSSNPSTTVPFTRALDPPPPRPPLGSPSRCSVLFSSASALLTIDDARMLSAMRARKKNAASKTIPLQEGQVDPSSSRKAKFGKRMTFAAAVGVLSVLLGLVVIAWSVNEVNQCQAMWDLELGEGASCATPTYYFARDANASCGLGRVVAIQCQPNSLTTNLPDRNTSRIYGTMNHLRCINLDNNSAVTKISHSWRHAPVLRLISVKDTAVNNLPWQICRNGSSSLSSGQIRLKGSPAAEAVDWSRADPPLHNLSTDMTAACRTAVVSAQTVNLAGNAINTAEAWKVVEETFLSMVHLDLSFNQMRGGWTVSGSKLTGDICEADVAHQVAPGEHERTGEADVGPSKGEVVKVPFYRLMTRRVLPYPSCRLNLHGNEIEGLLFCVPSDSPALHNWIRCLPDSLRFLALKGLTSTTS